MLHRVDVGSEPLDPYRPLVGDAICDEVIQLAQQLRDARIVHINATPYGGGVSELLRSSVPLLRGLGLDAEWQVISGDTAFFHVTKGLHNGLQGATYTLTAEDEEVYLLNNTRNARLLEGEYDFIIVHDPQPAALRQLHGRDNAIWVWRCHIDTSQPNAEVMAFITPFLEPYDAVVFTMADFILPSLTSHGVRLIQPSIDPLSPKNLDLPLDVCRRILSWVGIDLDRPLLTQVSRFDPWKDPLGVLRVYREVRREIPELQLALVGSMAHDDPEGWRIYDRITAETRGDSDITVATNLTGVSSLEVNAFQRLSSVVIQKSIREGFGLVISETLWKGTPAVAGRTGGIPLQMPENTGGFLVDPTDDGAFADRIRHLLRHAAEARDLGMSGREWVREHFLLPRMVADQLRLLVELGAKHTDNRYG
jgi:trehalose synthase